MGAATTVGYGGCGDLLSPIYQSRLETLSDNQAGATPLRYHGCERVWRFVIACLKSAIANRATRATQGATPNIKQNPFENVILAV
jgi:hypothetical protein